MAALGGREEGRKEKIEAFPPPRVEPRQWSNLTEEVEKTQTKKCLLSGERRELFGGKGC
jgi:hypothetical protein